MCQAHECAKCMALPGFSLDSHKHISTFVWKESDALWTNIGNSLDQKWETRSSIRAIKGDVVLRRFNKVKEPKK